MPFFSRTFTTTVSAQLAYTISWDYLDASHVKAKIDGENVTISSVVGNTVTLSADPGSGGAMMIYRETPLSTIFNFSRLGTPSSSGFNTVFTTVQYIAQEAADSLIGGAIILESENVFTANSKRITDVADGTEGSDAVNYSQLVAMAGSPTLLGSLSGLALEFLRVNAGETALETRSASEVRSDLSLGALATLNSVGSGQIDANAVGSSQIASGSVGSSEIASGAVDSDEIASGAVDLVHLSAEATPELTLSYTSSAQTITAAGLLTLAHSLGTTPKLIKLKLKNVTTQGNWAVDDEVEINIGFSGDSGADRGCSVYADSTNVYVRFTSTASSFVVFNKTTGAATPITNASWNLIVEAYA